MYKKTTMKSLISKLKIFPRVCATLYQSEQHFESRMLAPFFFFKEKRYQTGKMNAQVFVIKQKLEIF